MPVQEAPAVLEVLVAQEALVASVALEAIVPAVEASVVPAGSSI